MNNFLPLKPELKSSIAISLENVTTRYLDVHRNLFKFSLRRILPIPGLFEKIDYQALLVELQDIKSHLIVEMSRLKRTGLAAADVITENDKSFLSTSLSYTKKIIEAIVCLIGIIEKLHKKTLGDRTYTRQQYQTEVSSWERLDKEATSLYDQMARAYNPNIYGKK
ncbi:MAG: hypothetical protein A3H02_01295 [Candidatus Niyogibacteria bacterium RIFCSPLOWO2_12_FULL_41_13]|uniref:Uncharacterized protein n=1 Tax=Candidatus Niyogibacteria bacterium RIFCSPLOWO2_12_FULL_41_13 TaxID=1801726 RepID=A0A1G2F0U2_9BACT|nr:MAG: hypothetical protein A3H02_01295 [Candidatus Niyogibacteria bacterium RIFCSPLOWO2_12_FULL_41_13]